MSGAEWCYKAVGLVAVLHVSDHSSESTPFPFLLSESSGFGLSNHLVPNFLNDPQRAEILKKLSGLCNTWKWTIRRGTHVRHVTANCAMRDWWWFLKQWGSHLITPSSSRLAHGIISWLDTNGITQESGAFSPEFWNTDNISEMILWGLCKILSIDTGCWGFLFNGYSLVSSTWIRTSPQFLWFIFIHFPYFPPRWMTGSSLGSLATDRGALTLSATAEALPALLEEALRLRRAEATERNPLSSRSHAPWKDDGGAFFPSFVYHIWHTHNIYIYIHIYIYIDIYIHTYIYTMYVYVTSLISLISLISWKWFYDTNVGITWCHKPQKWLGMVYTIPTIYGDDGGMVHDIVIPTL